MWWLNALLSQTCSPDDAAGAVEWSVRGFTPAGTPPISGTALVGALRARRVERLALAIVEPGDPVGLPGPPEVTRAAVAAGLAAVAGDGTWTLIPAAGDPPLHWAASASIAHADPRAPLGTLGEARGLMREAMAHITRVAALDPDDEALAGLALYRGFPAPHPPPGIPARAAQVADAALRVWWLTQIAADLAQRRGLPVPAQVRRLRPLSRRAAAVAFSATPQVAS